MKFTTQLQVIGMKASKGTLENGNAYDSTKVYSLVDLDASKGTAKGASAVEYNFGTSEEFKKFEAYPFPFAATAELEITTNGKTQKTVLLSLKPASATSAKAA